MVGSAILSKAADKAESFCIPVCVASISTPNSLNWSIVLPRASRVKIDLNALPITAPPRAVLCSTAVTRPKSSLKLTPASSAVDPARLNASAKSCADTAKAVSTATILLTIWLAVRPADAKPLIAAVRALTDFSASSPEIRVRTKAALSLFAVSSALRP